MHRCNINVDYEWVIMCHWTVLLIKINTFNMITPIFTVACKKCPCIRTVTLLNTRSNEWMEDFFPSGSDLIGIGDGRRLISLFFSYWTKRDPFQNFLCGPPKSSPIFFGVGGDGLQDVKPQVWLDQIWREYFQDLIFVSSSLCINWYWYWIYTVEFDDDWVHHVHLDLW